ncbi:hypothetical protein OG792_24065 [Micromonospora sp. NBC_01699]|uniref:hypothetical protein n=1 Tax=Micromonospora sp. NBC_01699 TaxID=2975984 RepID=UPI002E2D2867|nr:hypothetical protein [Micromonospora sp. NBC_01699]
MLAAGLGVVSIAVALPASASTAVEPAAPHAAMFVPSALAVPGIAPSDADETAVYLDSTGRVMPRATGPDGATQRALIGCTPFSGKDNPHWSDPDVSGHGYWDKGTCSNNRANVYNCLYEFYTDNTWRQKACSPVEELAPGGGSANRTVARVRCADRTNTSWRNHVDVDVIGEIDTGETPHNQAIVDCRVY